MTDTNLYFVKYVSFYQKENLLKEFITLISLCESSNLLKDMKRMKLKGAEIIDEMRWDYYVPIIFKQNAWFYLNNSIFAPASKGDDSVAQLVEQYTFNVWVLGSSPSGITEITQ